MLSGIQQSFRQIFSATPLIVRSPGRINLIGEHTDYNEGFVLPAAIDKSVYVAVSARPDNKISLFSMNFNEAVELELSAVQPLKSWPTYILGVVDQLIGKGYPVKGFNLLVAGDIPVGAGLSSSAAVECAAVFALDQLFGFNIPRMEMIRLAQQAEHRFAGVQCGIMDMFASMMGKKDQVIRLDCRSLAYTYEPLQLQQYSLLLFNTNVKHSLASSAYNERRQQCEQGVIWVQAHQPAVKSLRDVSTEMLDQWVLPRDPLIYRRCRYVVEENQRLLDACKDLEAGNMAALGKKMLATHDGLSRDYEVSCKELDFLVEAVRQESGVLGARMMGGGFGGCTINIVESTKAGALTDRIACIYRAAMGLELTTYTVQTADGTSVIQ